MGGFDCILGGKHRRDMTERAFRRGSMLANFSGEIGV